jgi:hypothetical protein
MNKNISIIIISCSLLSCGEKTRINIPDEYTDFIGVWHTRHEHIQENSTQIDNMLLIISRDGNAVYRKCEINENNANNNKMSSRYTTEFPEAVVTSISKDEIVLYQTLFDKDWLGLDWELSIDKPPYQSNGGWHMNVEGKKLRKLTSEEAVAETNWECPDSDEKDEERQKEIIV